MFKKIVYSTVTLLLVGGVCFLVFGHDDSSTLLEDINKDGVVNILDLVLVATAFGQPTDRDAIQNPDVNRDGIINIFDLVRVANRFGETAATDNSTYRDIQEYIFDKSCANSACHAVPSNAGSLNLTAVLSYQDLVGRVPQNFAAASAGMKLVDPGNPDNSFLLTKLIRPTLPEHGAPMPLGRGPLHPGKIDAIRKWIAAGAPQEERLAGIGDLGVLRDPLEQFEPLPHPLPGEGYQIRVPPFKIEPGTEREIFYATQIADESGDPPQGDIFVNKYEIAYPTGSHHFIIYRLTEQGLEEGILELGVTPNIGVDPADSFRELDPLNPQALGNFGLHRVWVGGTQTGDKTTFAFPKGVALRLAGDTVFDLNAHFVNLLGTEPLIGEAYVNLYTVPPEEVEYEAVEIFASVKLDAIYVPPGEIRVVDRDLYVRDELARRGFAPDTVLNVVMLTSHMHRHGELFEINRISTGALLHRSIAYDNAPITIFDPPLALGTDDGLSFACTHNNYDKDAPITFGFTSEDEMCIMFGYYYASPSSSETVVE